MWGSTRVEIWPLSFSTLHYFNDLPDSLKLSKPLMFADDTNLTCTGQNPSEIELKKRYKAMV